MTRSFQIVLISLLLTATGIKAQDHASATPPEEQRQLALVRVAVPMAGLDQAGREAWENLAKTLAAEAMKPVRIHGCTSSTEAAKRLETGKVDLAVLDPEDYVRIAEVTENGATVAVLDVDGRYGFQAALLVRPDAAFGNEAEVLFSDAVIGLLRVDGFLGKFYRGPLTDERCRLRAEFRRRLEYGKSGEELMRRLEPGAVGRRIDAVLLPLGGLKEADQNGLRNGLRELWLSPFCPGRVVAARAGLGKRQRMLLGERLISAAREGLLKPAKVGGFRFIDDTAFAPLKEFLPSRRE